MSLQPVKISQETLLSNCTGLSKSGIRGEDTRYEFCWNKSWKVDKNGKINVQMSWWIILNGSDDEFGWYNEDKRAEKLIYNLV